LPTSLQTLNLSNTGLTGNFPNVSGLPQLQILKLADNGLTGTLTADNLPHSLQELDATHNQLTGTLPDLSQFNQLQRLLLGRNSFEGVTDFNFHPQLTTLIVSNNALRGELPDSLHKFNQLTTLDLGYNAWWAKNDSIAEFLSTKHPGWETTQTVTPTQLQAIALSGEAIQLTWTPILYTGDGGYYEIRYATQAGGPFDSPTAPPIKWPQVTPSWICNQKLLTILSSVVSPPLTVTKPMNYSATGARQCQLPRHRPCSKHRRLIIPFPPWRVA